MHFAKAVSILILLTLIASSTLALSHEAKVRTDNQSPAQGETSQAPASGAKQSANKSSSQRFKHPPARRSSTDELSLPAVSLVSLARNICRARLMSRSKETRIPSSVLALQRPA